MDEAPLSARPSRIPLPPSRLPRAIRPSPSNDTLRTPANGIPASRIRPEPSRDQLSSQVTIASSRRTYRGTDVSTAAVISKPAQNQPIPSPSNDKLFKRPATVPRQDLHPPTANAAVEISFEEESAPKLASTQRKPRPSLSERVLETLSQLPPSPAIRKRRDSTFFNPDSPMRPPSGGGNTGSRPTSRNQPEDPVRPPSGDSLHESSVDKIGQPIALEDISKVVPPTSTQNETPTKRLNKIKPLKAPKSVTDLRVSALASNTSLPADEGSPSSTNARKSATLRSSSPATVIPRPLRPRKSVGALVHKSMPEAEPHSASKELSALNPDGSSQKHDTARKSSLALRDQIAKAKAAKRAQESKQASTSVVAESAEKSAVPIDAFAYGQPNDPFNLLPDHDDMRELLCKRINSARTDGRLNIAAMGLKKFPAEVINMYDTDAMNVSWSECVDLTRLIAADNELESLDDVFPDVGVRHVSSDEDDDSKGNQFAGLETLDLHGNLLAKAPLGLCRLELLTTLNLSHNKLGNSCFDVVCQIPSLKVLSIAGNGLLGGLTPNITNLHNLEVLDLHSNQLTSLPDGIIDLVRLKILNLSENRFTAIPVETLKLPLIELSVAKNSLSGVFVQSDDAEMTFLKILDVSKNSLVSLTNGVLALPLLQQLDCSVNRITKLPDMRSWKSLLTLTAHDNQIADIPDGFTTLDKLKVADFSGNDLTAFDNRIGRMENLDNLTISGNPLKEKKFAGMSTEELKTVLRTRILHDPEEPPMTSQDEFSDAEYHSVPSTPVRSSSLEWPIKAGGVLDRSGTSSSSLSPLVIAQIEANNTIRVVELHQNVFQGIPSSLALFGRTLMTLSLAHNELSGNSFLKEDIDLEVLKELNLSSNAISSVEPLIQHFKAPQLEKLDISVNRLTSLPPMRPHFPQLTVILASSNAITALPAESVNGLKVLDCNNNDLGSLDARIGLLGGPGGLERLEVSGNRFRVPKYTVLEKGTEATLAWLKDRIPAADTSVEDVD